MRHGWNVIYFKDFSPKNSGKIIPNTLSPNSHWFSGKWPKLEKWAPPILHFEVHNRTTLRILSEVLFERVFLPKQWMNYCQEILQRNDQQHLRIVFFFWESFKKLYQQHLSQWFGFFHSPPHFFPPFLGGKSSKPP